MSVSTEIEFGRVSTEIEFGLFVTILLSLGTFFGSSAEVIVIRAVLVGGWVVVGVVFMVLFITGFVIIRVIVGSVWVVVVVWVVVLFRDIGTVVVVLRVVAVVGF